MKVGDLVRHKRKRLIGKICEIKRERAFVDWSYEGSVMFRWARLSDLEVLNKNR